MIHVQADQIKGARAMLGWTRDELADASGLSHGTIRNLEMGFLSPRGKTFEMLCTAFEEAGLEFTDEGIRRVRPDIKIIRDDNSQDTFFEILFRTAKRKGGDIVGIFKTQSIMMKALGIHKSSDIERLKRLLVHVDVKCLFLETDEMPLLLDNYESRMAPKLCNCATPYFVFGNSFAIVYPSEGTHRYVIFNDINMALDNKEHFDLTWEIAAPFITPVVKTRKNSVRI